MPSNRGIFFLFGIESEAMFLRRLLVVIIILGSVTFGSTLTRDEVNDHGSKVEDLELSAGKTLRDLEKDDFKVIRGKLKVRAKRSFRSSVVEENPNGDEDLDELFQDSMERRDRDSFDFDPADDIQESDERMVREEGREGEMENWKRSAPKVKNRKKKNSTSKLESEEETGYGNMNSSSIPSDLNKFIKRMHDPETAREFFHEYARLANFPRETINWDEPHLVYNCWVHAMLSGRFPYSPSCDVEGLFTTKQCFLQRCWCVYPETGKPVIKNHGERFYYKMAAVNLVCPRPTRPPHTSPPTTGNFTYFYLNQTLTPEQEDMEPTTKNTSARYNNSTTTPVKNKAKKKTTTPKT